MGKNGFTELEFGGKCCVLSYGHVLHRVLEARERSPDNVFGVIDLYRVKSIDKNLMVILRSHDGVVAVEEQCLSGGFGSAVLEAMSDSGLHMPVKRIGLEKRYYFVDGGREYLLERFGLSIDGIVRAVDEVLQ